MCSSDLESVCNAGYLGSIPGLGRSPGEQNSYPLQHSGLENSMDCIVRGFTKSQTGARGGFLPRHDEYLREPLVRRQGSQVSMRVARGERVLALESREGTRASPLLTP